MRELDAGGAEARVGDHLAAELVPHRRRERDGVPLHHEVDVRPVHHAEQGVAHRAAHEAHAGGVVRPGDARQHRIGRGPGTHRDSIGVVGDHVARNLDASAPIALDGLADAIARWEPCTLDELQAASDRIQGEVRAWAADPANSERPISESPVYLDRMAVEVLIERRFFTE